MTQYKVGDKVLVEATVGSIDTNGHIWLASITDESRGICSIDPKEIRPYTPRQEFEYGEEVEVSDSGDGWERAFYIGKSHSPNEKWPYSVNLKNGDYHGRLSYKQVRKLNTKPRETITIAGTTYDKAEFENAVRDLKPVEWK